MSKSPKPPRVAPFDQFPPMELKDRQRLIAILNDPAYILATQRMAAMKPSIIGARIQGEKAKAGKAKLNAICRMHELIGWEMYQSALYLQVQDPKPKRTQPEHNFNPADEQ